MAGGVLSTVFGTKNSRELKRMGKVVARINAFEADIEQLSDEELTQQTDTLKTRHADGASLDELLPEAFALVREAAKRAREMRHFDVQMIGGITLHEGRISEMRIESINSDGVTSISPAIKAAARFSEPGMTR